MNETGLTQEEYKRCGKNGRYDAELDRYFLDDMPAPLPTTPTETPVEVAVELPAETTTSKGKKS